MYVIKPELQKALEEFEHRRLWGQIQLDYQAGKLVVIRKQETIKPAEENNSSYVRYPK